MRENKVFVKMTGPESIQPPKNPKTTQSQPLQPQPQKTNYPANQKDSLGAMFSFMGKDEKAAIQQVFRLASITIMAQMNHYLQRMKEINRENQ